MEITTVNCLTWEDLLKSQLAEGAHLNLLVVDAEGYDGEIVMQVLGAGMRPEIIFFEDHPLGQKMVSIGRELERRTAGAKL